MANAGGGHPADPAELVNRAHLEYPERVTQWFADFATGAYASGENLGSKAGRGRHLHRRRMLQFMGNGWIRPNPLGELVKAEQARRRRAKEELFGLLYGAGGEVVGSFFTAQVHDAAEVRLGSRVGPEEPTREQWAEQVRNLMAAFGPGDAPAEYPHEFSHCYPVLSEGKFDRWIPPVGDCKGWFEK